MKRIKGIIFLGLSLILGLAVIAVCLYIQDKNCIQSINFVAYAENNTAQRIKLFHGDKKYYAFLPAYADFDTLKIESNSGGSIFLDDMYFDSDTSCAELKTDKEYSMEIKSFFGFTLLSEKLVIMKAENVAALSIDLSDGDIDEINADIEVTKSGEITVIKANKEIDYYGNFKGIHGRGNSTWSCNKKPYNIIFENSANILNMGDNTKYCLLSNSRDNSKLRNKIVYDAAKELGVDYAVDSEYVDLYVDNEYLGLYLITESTDVGENRININPLEDETQKVNYLPLSSYGSFVETIGDNTIKGIDIPNNPADITGGYLIESEDFNRDSIHNNTFTVSLSNWRGNPFLYSVKYPEYASKRQMEYISKFFYEAQSSFDNSFEEYIDTDSFVKYFLIRECFGNVDFCSTYFYKDSNKKEDKLHMGPIWDFDLSMGVFPSMELPLSNVLNVHTWGICQSIYENERFIRYVKVVYPSILAIMQEILDEKLKIYSDFIEKSFSMNHCRWKITKEYDSYFASSKGSLTNLVELNENKEYISNFLSKRIKFLNKIFVDDESYSTVFINMDTPNNNREKYFISIETGNVLEDISKHIPNVSGYKLSGFYDVNTGLEFDINQPITENVTLIAKWENQTVANTTLDDQNNTLDTSITGIFRKLFLGEYRYVFIGLMIIGIIILFILFFDVRRNIKSRRSRNE